MITSWLTYITIYYAILKFLGRINFFFIGIVRYQTTLIGTSAAFTHTILMSNELLVSSYYMHLLLSYRQFSINVFH